MRSVVEIAGSERPHVREGGVEQFETAVAAEHGDPFLQGIEGFALHSDRGIELRNEVIPLGDIVEEIGHPPLWIGADDGAQRPPVRQKPDLIVGFDRTGRRSGGLLSRPGSPPVRATAALP